MRPAQMGIEVLCFGDFHLDPQMKVTRPPGRDPASNALSNTSKNVPEANGSNGPRAATRTTAFHSSLAARSAKDH
jgi:hypothetical protein